MVILEAFDPDPTAILQPSPLPSPEAVLPDTAVSCFTQTMFRVLLDICGVSGQPAFYTPGMGCPVYSGSYKGKTLALFRSPVGAPACTAVLEDVYAAGVKKAVFFGTCGVLDRHIPDGSVIIPDSAVRDEGTSYHYAPPADEIPVPQKYRELLIQLLKQSGISYVCGKVWTTDAVYRETRRKTAARKQQGCICVDMECSALTAAAQFREKDLVQFFYAADNLDAEEWDPRSLSPERKKERKRQIATVAADLAAVISGTPSVSIPLL